MSKIFISGQLSMNLPWQELEPIIGRSRTLQKSPVDNAVEPLFGARRHVLGMRKRYPNPPFHARLDSWARPANIGSNGARPFGAPIRAL